MILFMNNENNFENLFKIKRKGLRNYSMSNVEIWPHLFL